MSGDDELTAENVAMMAAERLQQVDGFGPWGQATYEDVGSAQFRGQAAAYIAVRTPNGGDITQLYLTADPVPVEYAVPEFDWGARADRDRDAAIDRENGVTP
jgi:hypothetical protein